MMCCDHHVGHIEAAHAGRARADAPLAHFLPEQRAGLAPGVRVEQAGALEGAAAERHVDAERHARAELDRFAHRSRAARSPPSACRRGWAATPAAARPRSAARGRRRSRTRAARAPRRRGSASPPRTRTSSSVVTMMSPRRAPDAGVQRRAAALLALEEIAQRRRETSRAACFDDLARGVGRVVVDDDDFPGAVRAQRREARQRVAQIGGAVVGRDDDGVLHGVTADGRGPGARPRAAHAGTRFRAVPGVQRAMQARDAERGAAAAVVQRAEMFARPRRSRAVSSASRASAASRSVSKRADLRVEDRELAPGGRADAGRSFV